MTHDPPTPQANQQTEVVFASDLRPQLLEAQLLSLQAALTRARGLFEKSPGAAFLISPQGRILEVNTRGAALLRATPESLLGRGFTASLVASSQAPFTALLKRVCKGQVPWVTELQLRLPDGQVLEVALEAALRDAGAPDEAPFCHLTLTDVTAFKLAHRTLWATQQAQELELQDHVLKLRSLHEEFENVLLVAGRELDGTLTRAENFLSLWRRHPEAPEALGHSEEALAQTRSLLDALKRYMQIRFLRTRMRNVNTRQVLNEVLKDLKNQTAGRDVQITSAPLPTVYGDSQVLQIILHEYLSNALKFTRTRPQSRLGVLVQEDDTEYRIGVEDNGVGFNLRQKEKAFEMFGRLHFSKLYEGTGLGLAVVRRLCERFGGRAWGEGKVDQGAIFWFAWPKVQPPK